MKTSPRLVAKNAYSTNNIANKGSTENKNLLLIPIKKMSLIFLKNNYSVHLLDCNGSSRFTQNKCH